MLLLEEIASKTTEAESKKKLALGKSKEIEVQSKIIGKEKKEAEDALVLAMPALEAARSALDELDKNDVTEIRSFAKPPEVVQKVGECLCVLKGIKDASWKSAKGLMAETDFLKGLREFNAEGMTLSQVRTLKVLLKELKMTVEEMKEKSRAGAGLLKFVMAVVGFSDVYREVKPKKDRVATLEKQFNAAVKESEDLNRNLADLEAMLQSLKERYDKAMAEKAEIEEETRIMRRRLIAADKLLTGLTSENERWTEELIVLKKERTCLVGDCMISAGFLCYLGPFTFEYRQDLIHDWYTSLQGEGLPLSTDYTVQKFLVEDVEVSQWSSEGLPPDELSVQNGILTTRATRFAVCIDPQEQAYNWIRKKEEENNLKILSFADGDFLKQLELAIKYGFPVLFKNVDEVIDPIMENVGEKYY